MKKSIFVIVGGLLIFFSFVAAGRESGLQSVPNHAAAVQNSSALKVAADFGKMPLFFIPNRGQMDKQVAYYVQGKDKTIYFTDKGITFALTHAPKAKGQFLLRRHDGLTFKERGEDLRACHQAPQPSGESGGGRWVVKLDFVGANPDAAPIGLDETGALISYFKGKPEEWQAGLSTYAKIVYTNLWPGIDLIYYGTANQLKYEFIVHPGSDPSKIRVAKICYFDERIPKHAVGDFDGDGKDEIAVDFGSIGLWLWDNGAWSQLSGTIAEYLVPGDLDGDNKDEILADFGALGLWMWDGGAWSQISANNPD